MKRGSDDDMEGSSSKMARRDEDDDGSKAGRSGRIRKKSAKVLEMEEFEEIEKKQFSKKSDAKGKASLTQSPNAGAKKVKGKTDDGIAPATAMQSEILSTEAVSPNIVQEPAPVSPVKVSAKQAVGAKVKEGQGSVIKLLLSSPTIPSTPSVSTNVITGTSPPMSVSSSGNTIISAPAPTSTSKKSSVKTKTDVSLKVEPGLAAGEEELDNKEDVKTELDANKHLSPTASFPKTATLLAQTVFKSGASTTHVENGGSLKVKLMMSPKDTPKVENISSGSHSIASMLGDCPDTMDSPTAAAANNSNSSKKKSAPKTKKKKPAGEKSGKQASNKSAAEQMPNLAALVSTPKQPKIKEERHVNMSDGMDTSMSDTSLDMSSIVESALDMEEEAALVIAEGDPGPPKAKKKKKASGTSKKKTKAQAAVNMDMDSDEGMSTLPEGDIATLAAKVQRSAGATGGKKKASKKSLEQHEMAALDKKKRPSRRTPTAYMLYCNSQRPKVVAESPGIDFAQMSRTLGVMWQCLSKKEKMMWRRKSKKMAGKGSTLISTGKGNKRDHSSSSATPSASTSQAPSRKASKPSASAVSPAAAGDDTPQSPVKGFGIEPIDIAAHLKLLGESLSIIGNRLQEHKGLIAVQGSLSVLLDSMLCACGPLLTLTHQVPGLDGCSESTHARTLDSVAYIMPGL